MSIFDSVGSATATHYFKQGLVTQGKLINRLSSGTKLSTPSSDQAAISLSLKLSSSRIRLKSIEQNIQNAIAYLDIQEGFTESAGSIFLRIQELYGLYHSDPLKTKDGQEQSLYNNEYNDLVSQLDDIINAKFMGRRLFTDPFDDDEVFPVIISEDGGQSISIKTQDLNYALGVTLFETSLEDLDASGLQWDLDDFSIVREGIASSKKQLSIFAESLSRQNSSTSNSIERIQSIDVALEATSLAKQSILLQSSASMLVQASFSTDRVETLLNM